ncbi:pseudouridine synthase [Hirschia baltica]|uniref:Pseudouridine synthase n=1 Tax=Hirschia baltica (strain ATCC 49814 / DSM 5838 / IFAM 1418) TaxID=582402 RepID=C6XQT2_HIRBI|nr:pseudouridine synthase [Hirschia baltica]ACT58688.1 RNA-binding S4 domain protein [Hirschia baltica ATCC 49814]
MSERRETGRKPKSTQSTNRPAEKSVQSPDWSKGERIAKWLAAAGVCSRREAERLIEEGLVAVNGQVLDSAAFKVTGNEKITVEGKRVGGPDKTRLWRFHKPKGLVTTNSDPEGRPTVFEHLPKKLPRVMTIGRLDLNTEGLLLLTNDGELARTLELPTTGLKRCYRARAFGKITQAELDKLQEGVLFEGVVYRSIIATLDKTKGDNNWIDMTLTEGKKREARRALESVGLIVNRLIRVSYGPFELGDLVEGGVAEIPAGELLSEFGDSISRKRRPDPASVPQSYLEPDTKRRRTKGRDEDTSQTAPAKKPAATIKPLRGEKFEKPSSGREPAQRSHKRQTPHRYAALREGAETNPEPRDFSKPAKPGEAVVPASLAKTRKTTAPRKEADAVWITEADGTRRELPQRPKTAGSRRDRARAKGNTAHPTKEDVVRPRSLSERRQEKKGKTSSGEIGSRGDGGLPWNERAGATRGKPRPAGVRPAPKRGGSSSKTDRFNKGGKSGGPKGRR